MVIVGGRRFVGDIYQTKSGLAISTLFFHVMWVPIFPLASALVEDGQAIEEVPLAGGSIAMGYLRTLLLLGPMLLLFWAHLGLLPLLLVSLVPGYGLLALSRVVTRASKARCAQLEEMKQEARRRTLVAAVLASERASARF